jgi:acyl-CoA thioester hydrolase/thioesterase-3
MSVYAAFETEIAIRQDDIDMNNHVHSSKYFDYVLHARFEQMRLNYKMSMDEFLERGYTWFASVVHLEFKRAVVLADGHVVVKTQIEEIGGAQVKVLFWIKNKRTNKVAAEGYGNYTLVDVKTGKAARIPDDILEKYSVQRQ